MSKKKDTVEVPVELLERLARNAYRGALSVEEADRILAEHRRKQDPIRGPWKVGESYPDVIYDADDKYIGNMPGGHQHARLAAAAPELLDELRGWMQLIEEQYGSSNSEGLARTRALLARLGDIKAVTR